MRLNENDDRDIVEWLQVQDDKTLAVKQAIRLAMRDTPQRGDPELDLLAIRQVIEAVLSEWLQHVAIGALPLQQQGDPELDRKRDALF